MRTTISLLALSSICGLASAASPGAYSVVENDLSSPAKPPKIYVKCLRADQVDPRGFLVPGKTLASDETCKVGPVRAGEASVFRWNASCADDTEYAVIQRNAGDDFQIDATVGFAGAEIKARFHATRLDRACRPDDESF